MYTSWVQTEKVDDEIMKGKVQWSNLRQNWDWLRLQSRDIVSSDWCLWRRDGQCSAVVTYGRPTAGTVGEAYRSRCFGRRVPAILRDDYKLYCTTRGRSCWSLSRTVVWSCDVFCDYLTDWIKLLRAMYRQHACHVLSLSLNVRISCHEQYLIIHRTTQYSVNVVQNWVNAYNAACVLLHFIHQTSYYINNYCCC